MGSDITAALADVTDEQEILPVTVDQLQRAFNWPICAAMRLSGEDTTLAAHASRVALSFEWSQPAKSGLWAAACGGYAPW